MTDAKTIERVFFLPIGTGRTRLEVKTFRTPRLMRAFLGDEFYKPWKPSARGLQAGVYAFTGGAWQNVRTLSPDLLPHI